MSTPKDIYLSANILLEKHGKDAEEYATQKLLQFRQVNDEKAVAVWLAIIEAIRELRNTTRPINLH